ncbi:MAG: BtrH N-terminal domain-containing protein [Holophagaceae bacterium]|nr:BtrH N-terminal domain-containing protein [Holophagaceae bacterium]
MILDGYKHEPYAHCENGAITNAVNYYRPGGQKISEPMVFGIGAGLYFLYFPFWKIHNMPLLTYRNIPGFILKNFCKSLNIKTRVQKFRSVVKARQAMDEVLLQKRQPVLLRSGVYNLSYFPKALRFHFNSHLIVVVGKEGDSYYISDSVMGDLKQLSSDDLDLVRFAKGAFAPKGTMYYFENMPESLDLERGIRVGIKKTCANMVGALAGPIKGVNGIKLLSRVMKTWEKKLERSHAISILGYILRTQEEIGTGGAGFRYIYADFLSESSQLLQNSSLELFSKEMTQIGDSWREFACNAAKLFKSREEALSFADLSEDLFKIALKEEEFFKELREVKI